MTFLKRLVDDYMTALQAGLECRNERRSSLLLAPKPPVTHVRDLFRHFASPWQHPIGSLLQPQQLRQIWDNYRNPRRVDYHAWKSSRSTFLPWRQPKCL